MMHKSSEECQKVPELSCLEKQRLAARGNPKLGIPLLIARKEQENCVLKGQKSTTLGVV
jgi:hypothetical protein